MKFLIHFEIVFNFESQFFDLSISSLLHMKSVTLNQWRSQGEAKGAIAPHGPCLYV
jgi:hypothetical protein